VPNGGSVGPGSMDNEEIWENCRHAVYHVGRDLSAVAFSDLPPISHLLVPQQEGDVVIGDDKVGDVGTCATLSAVEERSSRDGGK
jgi:hypothetical protein